MPYISNNNDDVRQMLETVGVSGIEALFHSIPENLRLTEELRLPPAMSEPELVRHLEALAHKNRTGCISFMGGGIYNHYIPPVVWTLAMRPEFVTAYTPYQAEVAQGTLQAIYEFQSHLCRLTGLDVANASLYDGATAAAEAATLAVGHTGRTRIIVSETVSPMYRHVLTAMTSGRGWEIVTIPAKDGVTDYTALSGIVDQQAACVIVAQPNFFGYLEEVEPVGRAIHNAGGLLVMVVDPISLGILKTPAEYGADVAVGEGQALGIPPNFGGPLLGIFAAKKEFVRRMPGRLVGRTVDAEGKTGFVLTLQTREQHIRRDKATSNICTNEALCATAATIYMSLMGKHGLPRVARLSTERAHFLADNVRRINGYRIWTSQPFFKEFVIETPLPPSRLITELSREGIAAGIDLGDLYPALNRHLLVAVTETVSSSDCDHFCEALAKVAAG